MVRIAAKGFRHRSKKWRAIMRDLLKKVFLLVVLALLLTSTGAGQAGDNNTPLTNNSIIKFVHAGFKEKTIISIVAARPAAYDLSPDRMIELKHSGVGEKIILAMLARQEGMAVDDSWTDDPFLDPNSNNKKVDPKSTGENSTDIFGSSGSGQSSTRTRRGGGASVSGNTETTGTATVRIIRPPTEAGAAPKLERKTTLNNGSIIELVEAGFSDGTIIRRIEQSPVEFDFSANGVAELHKHRVSEKVLSAMKAAMGDDLNRSKTAPASDGTPKPE